MVGNGILPQSDMLHGMREVTDGSGATLHRMAHGSISRVHDQGWDWAEIRWLVGRGMRKDLGKTRRLVR